MPQGSTAGSWSNDMQLIPAIDLRGGRVAFVWSRATTIAKPATAMIRSNWVHCLTRMPGRASLHLV